MQTGKFKSKKLSRGKVYIIVKCSATVIDVNSYENGTFVDGQNINRSSDCIRVKIKNFNMTYFCNRPYDSWTKSINQWTYFYIDADTGETIGTDANYYHTDMGIRNRFYKF